MTQHALISRCEDTNNILQHQIFSTSFYLLCYNIKMVGQMPSLPYDRYLVPVIPWLVG